MMSTLAVFRREWTGRRNVFLLALGMGCIQLIALQVDPEPGHLYDKATFLAAGTGTLLAWVVAALFGATMVGRELEERRFGFLLNQPIGLGQIFLGKVAAGLGMAMLAAGLACLPPFVLDGLWRQLSLQGLLQVGGLWLAGSVVWLLLFHAVSIQVRSRSLWLVLDLTAWFAFVWGARHLSRRLSSIWAFTDMFHLWLVLLGVVTLGLGVAGYLQVAEGRADLQRGHRWVSMTLAISLGVALLIGWAQVAWVLKSRPLAPQIQPGSARGR